MATNCSRTEVCDWALVAAGSLLVGAAVAVLVAANIGADPYTSVVVGVAHVGGVGLTAAIIGCGFAIVAAGAALGVKPGLATLANPLLVSVGATVGASRAAGVVDVVGPYVAAAGALVALGVGAGLYLSTGRGAGPADTPALVVVAHTRRVTLRDALIGTHIVFVAFGWAVGGPSPSAVTVAAVVAVGPIISTTIDTVGRARRRVGAPEPVNTAHQ